VDETQASPAPETARWISAEFVDTQLRTVGTEFVEKMA
jgi:hypothetical protein